MVGKMRGMMMMVITVALKKETSVTHLHQKKVKWKVTMRNVKILTSGQSSRPLYRHPVKISPMGFHTWSHEYHQANNVLQQANLHQQTQP